MDLEGRLLGNRYELINKIGNGGMAKVYKAKDQVLNRYVAVKILRDEFTTDQEFIKRFEAEAQSAASITHPNIVSVYDVGNEGNLYYIVMELIQGKTLKEIIIEEGGALPWKWSINIATQIASALEVAHKNKIVHRDIKPHNIIITEDGIAKVTDFGIAKAVSNSTITAFGTTIGSVHYFSPEHARGGFTDSKSDLYSLGVVMYEMLTGRVPFDADTPVSVALKHMQEEPIPPIELNDKIPSSVNDIILKAMRKDTNLRYQNATEMLYDLKNSLKNPDGDFVDNKEYTSDMATKKISLKDIQEEERKNRNSKKENKFFKFIKKHKGLSFVICLVLLFVLSLGGTIAVSRLTEPKEVVLPNFVGVQIDEAKKIAEEKKLNIEVSSEEYNGQYQEGQIISQDPLYSENYNIKMGTTIKVVVSKGIEQAIVPKVVGMTEDEAIKALEDAKLKVQKVEEENKKIEAGYVISQETEPESKVLAGDTVVIHVSTGVKKVLVPSVIGKNEEEAKKTLSDLGFSVKTVNDEDTSKDNGIVLKQSLDVDKEVEVGTSITLTVNKLTETKSATVTVNVKSLLGGKVEYEETTEPEDKENETNSTTQKEKKVKEVEVRITTGDDTVYKNKVDPTTTNLVQSITGKGTVTVKVYIDGIKKAEKDINLNTTSSLTID
ncbi:MAG TPA: Stk1 family PASTA domain-containing Ser/Thr kinase [Clostridiales bacterium]|nr:Stk1 family PASTA domain-containing Ser/Thr kinase [Clostridiales bacterium]